MNRDEAIASIQDIRMRIEALATRMSPADWQNGVYENGWNAREVLCHLADDSITTTLIALAGMPDQMRRSMESARPSSSALGLDGFNNQQVRLRAGKSVDDLLLEIAANNARDINAVRNAQGELLEKHFRAPWGDEGPLAEVIVRSLSGHVDEHLSAIRASQDTVSRS